MAKPPVSEQVQVNFRMPVDLRDRIKRKAEEHGQSMNAEIVEALEHMFPAPRGVKDVLEDVITVLMYVEPDLRERAIEALVKEADSGSLSRWAEAYAHAEKDMTHRFPWEE
ncbi:MAG: Arc family DNA-binding protein [Roseovarius sp.]|nr:Arc family DNA-binding protein [Roseovarius sp.]